MRRYANEGREGANCCAYERDEKSAAEWKRQTGEEIDRGCISCNHFNGIKCAKGDE